MYYNAEILAVQQDEFTSLQQGSMTVMEAVQKFEQLARMYPELVQTEKEKVRRMMKMFRTDIAKQVSAGDNLPTLVSDCASRAIRAEYWINRDKEARAQIFKARKEEKAVGQKRNFPQKRNNRGREGNSVDYPSCAKCGKKHQGVWGRTLVICAARRDITPGTVTRTFRTRTFHIPTGMHPANCMRSKLKLKDPQFRKAVWRLLNPRPEFLPIQEEMLKQELLRW
ncbi:hypothetical protein TIFTF001_049270 [Ficus carica]|uniref:Retrotransposon gag domain-containing protein n=1 Tax=Ficus carica TaxID=3494 RepID=A0AA87ZKZ7_FICCA|nr:hypothetical protein TIFTF001_049270 [Ficus carica]